MEQPLSPKEQEWAGPEALCPGWLDEEVSDGEVPEDTGDPDSATHGYELLQSALRQEGLPLTVDHTKEPRTGTGHGGHGGWELGTQRQAVSWHWGARDGVAMGSHAC